MSLIKTTIIYQVYQTLILSQVKQFEFRFNKALFSRVENSNNSLPYFRSSHAKSKIGNRQREHLTSKTKTCELHFFTLPFLIFKRGGNHSIKVKQNEH